MLREPEQWHRTGVLDQLQLEGWAADHLCFFVPSLLDRFYHIFYILEQPQLFLLLCLSVLLSVDVTVIMQFCKNPVFAQVSLHCSQMKLNICRSKAVFHLAIFIEVSYVITLNDYVLQIDSQIRFI